MLHFDRRVHEYTAGLWSEGTACLVIFPLDFVLNRVKVVHVRQMAGGLSIPGGKRISLHAAKRFSSVQAAPREPSARMARNVRP